ncbi:type I-E CRISPR-associated protein Cas6/Cse3/CasE [Rhodoplanes sp. SY1]|uniref:type I-E CRISPR-associated protein Cas6/Cse3/CasE n=1 Tax=Rhodoplanes sp. SY1 TaxID=3166646 RepID=UPI0038B63FA1
MTSLFLTRAKLRRDPDVATLQRILLPEESDRRLEATHHLVWSLFAGDADARRDFLFRETTRPGGRPTFLVLSARPPRSEARLFEIETKPFAPELAPGDRLRFELHANPTIQAENPKTGTKGRYDVMTMAVMRLPEKVSQAEKARAVEDAARRWLGRQALSAGFEILERFDPELEPDADAPPGFDRAACDIDEEPVALLASGFQSAAVPGRRTARFGLIDYAGVLTVSDPTALLAGISKGFGRAKAYGCGLMLIRRA